jgi:hypothetical protein
VVKANKDQPPFKRTPAQPVCDVQARNERLLLAR